MHEPSCHLCRISISVEVFLATWDPVTSCHSGRNLEFSFFMCGVELKECCIIE